MYKKIALILLALALVASAGTVTKLATYTITLSKATTLGGAVLTAGDYKLVVGDNKITIVSRDGGKPVEAPVKIETAKAKFDYTVITYKDVNGAAIFSEIDLGGSKTVLLFEK